MLTKIGGLVRHRYDQVNIPTEIIRTLVLISETGTFTGAGERLNLSQPAVSAQMKRLQVMTGGEIFKKAAGGGVELTERGHLVLAQARRMLDANDQILSLGGAARDSRVVRLGVSVLYAESMLALWKDSELTEPVHIYCNQSSEVARLLIEGYLDVACIVQPRSNCGTLVQEWTEDYIWLKASNFVLSPGAPIPVVCWPGSITDQPAIEALEARSLAYRVVFTSNDLRSRIAAVRAGLGVMASIPSFADGQVVIANDFYLPALTARTCGIYLRDGFEGPRAKAVIEVLRQLQPKARHHDAVLQPR